MGLTERAKDKRVQREGFRVPVEQIGIFAGIRSELGHTCVESARLILLQKKADDHSSLR